MNTNIAETENELWVTVSAELQDQGFSVLDGELRLEQSLTKDYLRSIHEKAVAHKVQRARPSLERFQAELMSRIAMGEEIDACRISPRLIEVTSGSRDELLFRFCSLHWSIPVSSGYGRRLRFLLVDEANDKLIGLIGLADPVFALGDRDSWIGWTPEDRNRRLRHVMDAFVVGAVPPYNQLLCGKLVAMALASVEVSSAFRRKYQGAKSRISGETFNGDLCLITTASALGRSSVYNRISYGGEKLFHHLGYTRGYGEFHFLNGTYELIKNYVDENCVPSRRHERWGQGFRNRSEVVREFLRSVGKSDKFRQHTIHRELFAVPQAANWRDYLTGRTDKVLQTELSLESLYQSFHSRWLTPRLERMAEVKQYDNSSYRLW